MRVSSAQVRNCVDGEPLTKPRYETAVLSDSSVDSVNGERKPRTTQHTAEPANPSHPPEVLRRSSGPQGLDIRRDGRPKGVHGRREDLRQGDVLCRNHGGVQGEELRGVARDTHRECGVNERDAYTEGPKTEHARPATRT